MTRTSIATVSLSGTLREKIAAIAEAGFDGVEIFEQDFIADASSPAEIGDMIRDHGLEVMLFQPFRDFETLPEPERARAFDRAERKFDVMQELGTDLVLVCSSVHPLALGGIDRAANDFRALGERAAMRGLRVGFEALAWGTHFNDHRDAWEVVRRADHDNVGLIVDSFHTLGRGLDPGSIRAVPGDKIFFVQLADAPAIEMDLLYWSRHFRNMPGEGDLDVAEFMQAVMATGYTGPISLEIFNDLFRGGNTRNIARDGYRSLINLIDEVDHASPAVSPRSKPLPRPPAPSGISFVEFASRNDEAKALKSQLRALGFAQTGVHRSRPVSLWQQGDIRFVINEDTTGHAATAWNTKGTNVCCLGIDVADAEAVVARAIALGDQPFGDPLDPDVVGLPGIRGLSGSVIQMTDSLSKSADLWQQQFGPKSSAPSHGLTHIDHVAQTMSYDEMLSWSLFYTTLFDMEKSPLVDLVDPDGIVRSQAVQTSDGAMRITLNGADTHRTLAGAFLADSFGASVQHIALGTDDIFACIADLSARGFEALPISPNYYADLASRFTLSETLVDKMQAASVLYDEDAGGSFYQCYARAANFGFFFEIVQRAPGYRGYGGPNAPFRIAAQKRLGRVKGMPSI